MAVDNSVKKSGKETKENKFIKFWKELKAEFKRITWASKETTKKSLIAVLVFIVIWVAITSGIDFSFKKLFDVIFQVR